MSIAKVVGSGSFMGHSAWFRSIRVGLLIVVLTACSPTSSSGSGYQAEYGGSAGVYAQIVADTDCANLQETFNRAEANNQSATTDEERDWTIGYMTASNDRMQALNC